MEYSKKRRAPRLTAILLSLMMVVVFIPTFAFAANAKTITVYMTVSSAGTLAKANDGSLMASKEVKVTDLDNDGHFTYDEALVAAHKAYNSADGYQCSAYVTKLWGVETGGSCLFYVNNEGLPNGVKDDEVKNGDFLTAAVLADTSYYSDWYATFDVNKKSTTVGSAITLNLKGHLGMAYTDEAKKYVALPGVSVMDGSGKALGTTDEKGNVKVSFAQAGTYIVTATGVKKDAVVSTYGMSGGKTEDGKYYCTNYSGDYLYTDADYGDGPYPAGEIKTISMEDWFDLEEEEQAEYHLVYADNYVNQYEAYYPVLTDAPLIAPAAIITVTKPSIAKATVTVKNATYTGKALKPAVTVKLGSATLKAGTDYTAAYSNNTKAGKGKVTVTGKGKYTGSASKTFTIAKAAQPLKVTGKTAKIKYKKLKKKKQKLDVSKVLAVSGAQGKVTYTKVSGKKKITIDKNTGKITVKKKLKKGTYKVKVKVSAAGNANYKAGEKTVTVTIKVKKK